LDYEFDVDSFENVSTLTLVSQKNEVVKMLKFLEKVGLIWTMNLM
jgi:hypothetical protein